MTDQVQPAEAAPGKVAGWLGAVRQFLVDVRAEMKKVSWPTREELIDATRRVVIMTLVIGTAIGLLDLVLQKVLFDGVAALAR